MSRLERRDGAEIHWEHRGDGPTVVIANWWSVYPPALEPLATDLERDHRVVIYHDRGVGASTRAGPYDLDTAADDLAAVVEAAGAPAVIIGLGDGPNRGIRVAARTPDLVAGVVSVGGAPLGRELFAGADVLVSSDTVVGALIQQAETDYRGALRGLLAVTNEHLSEAELGARVAEQSQFARQESAVARLRAWAEDEPLDLARATGDRLWVLVYEALAGGWFPVGKELAKVVGEVLPEARVVAVEDGIVSRPDQTAEVVRSITRATAGVSGDAATSP